MEVEHLGETTDLSPNQARELLRRHGNDFAKIREGRKISKLKGEVLTPVAAICRFLVFACLVSAVSIAPAAATASLSQDSINSASIAGRTAASGQQPHAFLIRIQVLLDRSGLSPGVIDGLPGENLAKAVRTFEDRVGLEADGEIDEAMWDALKDGCRPGDANLCDHGGRCVRPLCQGDI